MFAIVWVVVKDNDQCILCHNHSMHHYGSVAKGHQRRDPGPSGPKVLRNAAHTFVTRV